MSRRRGAPRHALGGANDEVRNAYPSREGVASTGPAHASCCDHTVRCRAHLGLRDIEELTLDTLRHVCLTQARDGVVGVAAGSQFAERFIGQHHAGRLAHELGSLVRAVQTERNGPFHFMDPGCTLVTDDELDLLRLIRFGRFTQEDILRTAATRFARGAAPLGLVARSRALALQQQKIAASTGPAAEIQRRLH